MIKRVQVSDISKKRYLIKKKFLNILSSLREKKKGLQINIWSATTQK